MNVTEVWMGQRQGFWELLEHEAAQRREAAAQRRQAEQQREESQRRQSANQQQRVPRTSAEGERQRKQQYEQDRRVKAEQMTKALQARIGELESLLPTSLHASARVDLDQFKRVAGPVPFDPSMLGVAPAAPRWEEFAPRPPGPIGRVFGGEQRHERAQTAAKERFEQAHRLHSAEMARWEEGRRRAQQEHADRQAAHKAAVDQHNAAIEEFERRLRAGEPDAVEEYFDQLLQLSDYPTDVSHACRVSYQPEPRRLVIECELPGRQIIPEHVDYRYIKAHDAIEPRPRAAREVQQRYEAVVSQVALRTIREIFTAGWDEVVDSVVFNGHVSRKNPATGQPERPCILTVGTTREDFAGLVLADVQPRACLRHLNALVSPHPHDLEPVSPLVDFDLSRYRFSDEDVDAIAALDSRKDLLKITPTEFEHLIRELFEAMGLQAWVTRASRDDGVDAVAINPDPIVGGLCVIQAKRYSGVVSTESVRALAGVMDDKRAAKGVLVTTSWLGPESQEFAARHGRMELIEGSHLKHLLKQHLDRDVLISLPKQPPRRRQASPLGARQATGRRRRPTGSTP